MEVYIPSVIIVMVTWISFWISPAAVPARTGICVTAILTIITMLGISNYNMPKVSYVKLVDLYLFVCFVFVFSSFIEYIVVLNAKKKRRCCSDETPKDERRKKHVQLVGWFK